ncbi:MAG TPA: phage tail tape measure protein, partial [Guyparkeria sp.]|nr:phage tail tape measure protein [Guyparkeria sp.]
MAEVGSLFIRLKAQASEFERAMEGVGNKVSGIGGTMKDVGGDLTKNVTAPIIGIGGASVAAAIDFESAFAGVRKTVDGSEGDFERLESGIREMAQELPAS